VVSALDLLLVRRRWKKGGQSTFLRARPLPTVFMAQKVL
jgi:hypothetical protein